MMKREENKDFELVNNELPEECKDPEIKKEDFVLTTVDGKVHEQKFQTKPTTFFKDSMRRFAKNKSSVVAAYILGALILLAIIVPLVSPYDVSQTAVLDNAFINLEPKLFNNANGFWDGTKKDEHVAINANTGYPDEKVYKQEGIISMTQPSLQYTDIANDYATGGYLKFGYFGGFGIHESVINSRDTSLESLGDDHFVLDLTTTQLTLKTFETVDADKIKHYQPTGGIKLPTSVIPENFELGNTTLQFCYSANEGGSIVEHAIDLTDSIVVHNTGAEWSEVATPSIDINDVIDNFTSQTSFDNFYIAIKVEGDSTKLATNYCSLVKSLEIEVTSKNASEVDTKTKNYFEGYDASDSVHIDGVSFKDGNDIARRLDKLKGIIGGKEKTVTNIGYWLRKDVNRYPFSTYLSLCQYVDLVYDTYKGALGKRVIPLSNWTLDEYMANGWIYYEVTYGKDSDNKYYIKTFEMDILNKAKCPFTSEITKEQIYDVARMEDFYVFSFDAEVLYYKYLGYETMPSFLFGTDVNGRDMFKYVFEGLRNSLALGVFVFIICFLIGLAWGAISGYFGGAVDLIMERITDILSGLPWIVIMTLVVLKAETASFGTFAFALCLTGWIGTASLTRTQFYRFRGREYVLASRTLGASHARLITRHILPNAMGTIITSAVLMIPSIIFQEATISYLGLGFKNLSSLGVILSNNQNQLTNHPYQLLFPSVVIALVMISFNLFGNGLRDAINPSLKGEDE